MGREKTGTAVPAKLSAPPSLSALHIVVTRPSPALQCSCHPSTTPPTHPPTGRQDRHSPLLLQIEYERQLPRGDAEGQHKVGKRQVDKHLCSGKNRRTGGGKAGQCEQRCRGWVA